MSGEKDLNKLLKGMSPTLKETEYIFTTIPGGRYGQYMHFHPLASFVEDEGLTLIIPKDEADRNSLNYSGVFRCITLTVHSSLEAVGFTSAVSTKLADHGISANVIAAYFHDHIFIESEKALEAIEVLNNQATDL